MSRSALIVVDMQNDFCPPDGSLAVLGGREIIDNINKLLGLTSFVIKVATKDYHPQDHISFASNHEAPDNRPFESYAVMTNIVGGKPEETMRQRLWPVHCVQDTWGSDLVDGLDESMIDLTVRKGMDSRVEMYSAFADNFGNMTAGKGGVSHDLAQVLHEQNVSDVYVVGIAGDYCVRDTAIGAAKAGFNTCVVEECQKCVDADAWPQTRVDLGQAGVKVVSIHDEEVTKLGIHLDRP